MISTKEFAVLQTKRQVVAGGRLKDDGAKPKWATTVEGGEEVSFS